MHYFELSHYNIIYHHTLDRTSAVSPALHSPHPAPLPPLLVTSPRLDALCGPKPVCMQGAAPRMCAYCELHSSRATGSSRFVVVRNRRHAADSSFVVLINSALSLWPLSGGEAHPYSQHPSRVHIQALLAPSSIQKGTRVLISLWDSLMLGRVPGER